MQIIFKRIIWGANAARCAGYSTSVAAERSLSVPRRAPRALKKRRTAKTNCILVHVTSSVHLD